MQLVLKLEASLAGEPPQKRAWITDRGTMTVGRVGGDFQLPPDGKVSSTHFRITCDGKQCLLEDLKSTNGTFLNEVRIKQARLRDGDQIRIGETKFSVQITGAVATEELETGPDMLRASSSLSISGDEPPAKPDRKEPVRFFNKTTYAYASVPGRVRFPGHSITLIVKGTFDLLAGKVAKPVEEQVPVLGPVPYPDAEHELAAPRYPTDVACFKPKADLLLVGACHAPGGQPTPRCEVEFRVGQKGLRLAVSGKRRWEGLLGGAMSEAQPFTQVPLRYEYAYGGEGYPRNPTGLGFVQVNATEEGKKMLPLPQIEDLQKRMTMRVDKPEPAGLGPLAEQWEQRKKHLGTYDETWVKTRWPWYASNFNWAFCNAAPEALQTDYLRGDEELYLENLHPQHAKFTARLPGKRVRCFLYEAHGEERKFREVSMALDTLWVDAEAGKLVLVWRGVAAVASPELEELRSVFFMEEPLEAPQSANDCLLAFRQARAEWEAQWAEEPEDPATVIAEEEPAEPEPAAEPDEQTRQIEEIQAKSFADIRATLVAAGVDPENPPQPTEAEKREAYALLRSMGINPPEDEAPPDPSPWTRQRVAEKVAAGESLEGENLNGLDLSGMNLAGANLTEASLEGANLAGADLSGAVCNEANLNQAKLTGAKLAGASFLEAALAGADLSQASGADALFASARMLGTDLTRCDLPNAVCEGALLVGAKAPGARFVQAIFARAKLSGADFTESVLSEADLSDADLTGARLERANLTGALLANADLTGANLERASGTDAIFAGARLVDARLTESTFPKAVFTKSHLQRATFAGADLAEACFEEADARQANFTRANLTNLRAAQGRFSAAKLREVRAAGAVWSGGALAAADFSRAIAPGCDFTKANLERVVFRAAVLRASRFDEAGLKHADLRQADLFEGSLAKADLTEADFSEANMFGVDFAETLLDRVKSDGANLKRTRLVKV